MTDSLERIGLRPGGRVTALEASSPDRQRVICSLATGAHLDLLAISAPTFVDYGQRWGWDVVLSAEESLADGRPVPWGKVELVRQLLDGYEWVLWFDADAIVVEPDTDITSLIRPEKDLYLVEMTLPRGRRIANSGVFLVHRSRWSRELLAAVWAQERLIEHKWWDNAALLKVLGYSGKGFAVRPSAPQLHHVEFIDRAWNSSLLDPSPRPFVKHYAGVADMARRSELLQADRAGAGGRPAKPVPMRVAGVPCRSRLDLPQVLLALGLLDCGVEVGVKRGEFSEHLLEHWPGRTLISIDPWAPDDEEAYRDIANVSQAEHEANFIETRARLSRFGERSEIWRVASNDAAARIAASSLDFAYIDARHDERSVTEDLELWWNCIRPGGVLCGHDYLDRRFDWGHIRVKAAVDRFFGRLGLPVEVMGKEKFPSWLVLRPPPEPEDGAILEGVTPEDLRDLLQNLSTRLGALTDRIEAVEERLDQLDRRPTFMKRIDSFYREQRLRDLRIGGQVEALARLSMPRELRPQQVPYLLNFHRLGITSQNGEEGMLAALLALLGPPLGRFVEIGCGDNGGNSGFFAGELGWKGLMVDHAPVALEACRARFGHNTGVRFVDTTISPETVNDVICGAGFEGEIDYVSIDIDGHDYWVLEALEACNPRVLLLEYNAYLGSEHSLAIPRDADLTTAPRPFFGASLAALAKLADRKGYRLLACEETGVNAFFLRNNLREEIPRVDVRAAFRPIRRSYGPADTPLRNVEKAMRALNDSGLEFERV